MGVQHIGLGDLCPSSRSKGTAEPNGRKGTPEQIGDGNRIIALRNSLKLQDSRSHKSGAIPYVSEDKAMSIDLTQLRAQSLKKVWKAGHSWEFRFSSADAVITEDAWRLISDTGIIVTSEDDGQAFGLPAPVDAAERLCDSLKENSIDEARHDPHTGDLFLKFTNGKTLHLLQLSSGYESWRLLMGSEEYICMGGGDYTSFPRTNR